MGNAVHESPVQGSDRPAPPASAFEIVCESAIGAAIKAFLVLLFGNIALGLVSGILQDMTPSHPPGFGVTAERDVDPDTSHAWAVPLSEYRFLIVFGLIFVPTVWGRLSTSGAATGMARRASRLRRIAARLYEQWFSLVVGNAFGALISAIIVVWVQQWSLPATVVNWVIETAVAGFQTVAQHLFGRGDDVQNWFRWYGENQLKFTFWFLYMAAIIDDLGLPNFKTLGRWLGRRVRQCRKAKVELRTQAEPRK